MVVVRVLPEYCDWMWELPRNWHGARGRTDRPWRGECEVRQSVAALRGGEW